MNELRPKRDTSLFGSLLRVIVIDMANLPPPNGRNIHHSKTKSYRFFAFGKWAGGNLVAAPVVTSQTERSSASLSGGTRCLQLIAPARALRDDDPPGMITFSLTFSGLSSPLTVAHLHFAPTRSLVA